MSSLMHVAAAGVAAVVAAVVAAGVAAAHTNTHTIDSILSQVERHDGLGL